MTYVQLTKFGLQNVYHARGNWGNFCRMPFKLSAVRVLAQPAARRHAKQHKHGYFTAVLALLMQSQRTVIKVGIKMTGYNMSGAAMANPE